MKRTVVAQLVKAQINMETWFLGSYPHDIISNFLLQYDSPCVYGLIYEVILRLKIGN